MKDSASRSNDIHAYIDGELSSQEKLEFEELIKQDPELKAEVCDLRKIKQQVLTHYQQTPVPPLHRTQKPKTAYWGVAASLVMAVGVGFFTAYGLNIGQSNPTDSYVVAAQQQPNKVLLHIDSNQSDRTAAVLQKAKKLLEENQNAAQPVQVEIVANHDGIDMFEKGNPSKTEIMALLMQYNNLKLVACQRALERRATSGHPVALIDQVETDKIAVDDIVQKMQQGWGYQKF